jgi:hypothetical protein
MYLYAFRRIVSCACNWHELRSTLSKQRKTRHCRICLLAQHCWNDPLAFNHFSAKTSLALLMTMTMSSDDDDDEQPISLLSAGTIAAARMQPPSDSVEEADDGEQPISLLSAGTMTAASKLSRAAEDDAVDKRQPATPREDAEEGDAAAQPATLREDAEEGVAAVQLQMMPLTPKRRKAKQQQPQPSPMPTSSSSASSESSASSPSQRHPPSLFQAVMPSRKASMPRGMARSNTVSLRAALPQHPIGAKALPVCPDTKTAPRKIPPPPKAAAVLQSCPDSLKLPIEWDQVLYFQDPRTGERKFDRVTSPIAPLPHPDLEFSGYVVSDDRWTISAFFKKKGLTHTRGCRLPREAGGKKGWWGVRDPEI